MMILHMKSLGLYALDILSHDWSVHIVLYRQFITVGDGEGFFALYKFNPGLFLNA